MSRQLRPPRRFDRLIEAVCARDRQYLEQHPDEVAYVRPYVPGEFWPRVLPQDTVMLVARLAASRADARQRIPMPGHTADGLRRALADPRVTLFTRSLDGTSLVPLGEVLT